MGIEVAMTTERGEPIQQVFDAQQVLTALAMGPWQSMSSSVCVRFIDPWGDAVFNQAQLPYLLSELRQSMAAATDPRVREHLEEVCRLVEQAQNEGMHTYVKFIGD
jgi:hypothetical protein